MEESERRKRYAAALRAMCKLRGIAPTGYALAKFLRAAGHPVHANTLDKHLKGERYPRGSTVEKILRGLSATDAERTLLLSPGPSPARPSVLSWRDALVHGVDKGREREEVAWWHRVGLTDDGDLCIEQRRTVVGTGGLQAVSFGPGQLGNLAFDLLDTSRLGLQVHAQRLSRDGLHPVPAAAHVVQVEPQANRYGMIVRFGQIISPVETLVWRVSYRWPGLWRSLRLKGTSSSNLNFSEPPSVIKMTVEVVAALEEFGDLVLLRLSPDSGTLEQREAGNDRQIRWVVHSPPSSVRFQLSSPRHAKPKESPGA
ncbi:MAG TPA: hypothetical protein VK988_17690 [Acidimicrobiales bacterium]|nr:hypothetical protein [Acidimicrobiales bacterium]